MSDLTDVLHWLRPSNWAGVESGKAAQTLVVITELQAENERLREALERIARLVDDDPVVITLVSIANKALEGGDDE